jgi:hypothetical protein
MFRDIEYHVPVNRSAVRKQLLLNHKGSEPDGLKIDWEHSPKGYYSYGGRGVPAFPAV